MIFGLGAAAGAGCTKNKEIRPMAKVIKRGSRKIGNERFIAIIVSGHPAMPKHRFQRVGSPRSAPAALQQTNSADGQQSQRARLGDAAGLEVAQHQRSRAV